MKNSHHKINDIKKASIESLEIKPDKPKLKKFNVNTTNELIEITNRHMKELELIDQQRKQDIVKAQNDIEKNKNLLRGLLYDKTDDTVANKLKNSFFTCQMCKTQASITQRTRIFGIIYHRDCIKCITCGVIVRNAESLCQKDQNDQSKSI